MKKHSLVMLLFACMILLGGCFADRSPKGIVKTELDLIQDLDEDTILSFISYEDMMQTQSSNSDIGSETTEAVQMFFENFDYKIQSCDITDKKATVEVEITNIDTKALAKDMCRAIISQSVSADSEQDLTDMSSYFSLMGKILSENTYDLVTTTAHFDLVNSEDGWSIQVTETLEDELVGGFISCLHDKNLISPEEVVSLTMDALKAMTPQEWVSYLGMDDIFATYNTLGSEIDLALAQQISTHLSYDVREARVEETTAQVDVEITSLDLKQVLSKYQDELLAYADTTEAVRATASELSDKTSQLLLDCLRENQAATSHTVTLNLTNNGYNWEIQFDDSFTDALLGNLTEAMETFQSSVEQS